METLFLCVESGGSGELELGSWMICENKWIFSDV